MSTEKTKDEQGYQGWENYETWVTALWLDNDQGTYNAVRDLAKDAKWNGKACSQVKEKIWTEKTAIRLWLSNAIKNLVEDLLPELEASLASDLLGSATEKIDFEKIAENILAE